jgi:ferredoxin
MTLSGDTCVSPGPDVTLVTPTDPPIGSFGNSAAGNSPPSGLPPEAPEPPEPPEPPITELPVTPINPIAPAELLPPEEITPPELVCAAPLVACHGQCISVTSDGMNCGACGKICPSNICVDGECMGAMPGDVVLIGHDYSSALSYSAHAKVLANAIGIPTTDPIRVLSYEDGASPEAVANAKAVARDSVFGRKIQFTKAASAGDLESETLGRSYDVVILHDASAGNPATTGASWKTSLGGFTMKGGVVVALDNGNSPMPALLSSAELLAVGGHTKLASGTHLLVSSAADVVGAQVLSPYAAFGAPVSFQGLPAPSVDMNWVVRAKNANGTAGDAVVVHRIVR